MEDCQYKLSNQCNTSTDLVNVKVAVKKEDSLENSEDFSTNSALCDMELKSEEGFSRDIKPEMIESEPTEELATEFFGDSQSGMNDVQHDVIEELVMKKELPSSADAHSEYDIPLTESDEAGVHFEHVKIEKIELGESELLYPCEVCKKVFVDEKDLIEHKSGKIDCIALEVDENEWNKEEKLSQDETPSREKILPSTSDSKESRANIDKERLFTCEHCSKCFSTKGILSVHRIVHKEARPFQCKVCSRAFKRNGDLVKHERLHEGVKPYQCSFCPESFAQKDYLRKHEKKHADDRFQCESCPKYFLSKSDLTYHEKNHAEKKPFQCKICPKAFRRNFKLMEHEQLHAGVRPFQCRLCSKTFALKSYLNIHEKIHAPKTFQCDICSDLFSRKKYLLAHIKTHINNRLIYG